MTSLPFSSLTLHRSLSTLPPPNSISAGFSATASSNQSLRVVLSGGGTGTGGHIYPAIAIADSLKTLNPQIQFLFIGTPTGIESAAAPAAGYQFAGAPTSPLSRPLLSLANLFILPFILINSIHNSFKILQKFDPHIVIGTGGYVSFPTCIAAAIKGVKLIIQEQNSVRGIANLVLSIFAYRICVAFDSIVSCFWNRDKCVVFGNPVRFSLMKCVSKILAMRHFFPKLEGEGNKVVLILGGSLGANAINLTVLNSYYDMLNDREDLFIIWQTGVKVFDQMERLVRSHPRLFISLFLHAMDLAYSAADLVVSRSGAMTCSEILATGKPSVMIPSPYVAEGHQFKNAALMAELAGSRVILEEELNSTTLRAVIREILDDENLMAEMSERALKAAKPNASAESAKLILSLVNLHEAKK